jgi:hypothetical protein
MLAFHKTLETFFRKLFEEEMLRLSFDAPTGPSGKLKNA